MNSTQIKKGVENQPPILNRAKAMLASIVETLDYDPQTEIYGALGRLASDIERLDARLSELEPEM